MDAVPFKQFEAEARSRGFDEVVEREWGPSVVVKPHSHPFAVHALVVRGEMWLTVDGEARHLLRGDTFDLDPGCEHAERYGSDGATYWAARRNTPASDAAG